jgi:sugar-specific transcriptional regulator TrmB
MYANILQKLGLSPNEAKIYEMLLNRGESKASDLVPESGLGRGNVYNLLTALVSRGLATVTAGKQQIYRAAEPTRLVSLVEAKKLATDLLEAEFKLELPKLNSVFNLTTGRPAIQVFEGVAGFEEALNDSLTAKTEILTYLDPAAIMTGEFAEVNRRYVAKRRKAGINKRIILSDTPASHQYLAGMSGPFTQVILAKSFGVGFMTVMELYDNKVVFLTLTKDNPISVMIEDINIVNLQRAQFDYIWKLAGQAAAASNESADNLASNAK